MMQLDAAALDSLESFSDPVAWLNNTLGTQNPKDLSELDQYITNLIATLDIACEDTSSTLETAIDDVSRGVPRLIYDLHFMKDSAVSLQHALLNVQHQTQSVTPEVTGLALDRLRLLDTIKSRMEAAREVLREAESWSTLELEVTSLLAERNYAKAATRLSEASRSMVVFQNTPDYDPRRALMVNLQNQLEASLSSALVAAINIQDLAACRTYFSIFSNIQRETEFRSYYYGSRKASLVSMWQNNELADCEPGTDSTQTFVEFLPKFYASFGNLLNTERTSIPSIFPDPPHTLSALISAVLSSLQPTFSQRLSSLVNHYGGSALRELILVFRSTEDFAISTQKVMEKIKYSAALSTDEADSSDKPLVPPHSRRRSMRLSVSWRSSSQKNVQSKAIVGLSDELEWETELFQPFLDFQCDYGALERNTLEDSLREIISTDQSRPGLDVDQARLLRERAVDVFGIAEESISRCNAFTYGYASVALVGTLDGFLKSFVDLWTADISMVSSSTSVSPDGTSDDLDYSDQDWSEYQNLVHLLAAARAVFDRLLSFESKLRTSLSQTAARFRLAQNDPLNFPIALSKGENSLLEQSTLNSAQLQTLWDSVEVDHPNVGHSRTVQSTSHDPLLHEARDAVYGFARACQIALQETILSPLKKHLAIYSSSSLWTKAGDPKARHTISTHDLQVPSFSMSPSDIIQRVVEGLYNLPRLFEVYADDDALSFSLHTLPFVDDAFKNPEQAVYYDSTPSSQPGHMRRASLQNVRPSLDHDTVSSAWLSSLGRTLFKHLTVNTLPKIATLTSAGAAQLASDLEYLGRIMRALNMEYPELDTWREYSEMDDEAGRNRVAAGDSSDIVLEHMSRLRGWKSKVH